MKYTLNPLFNTGITTLLKPLKQCVSSYPVPPTNCLELFWSVQTFLILKIINIGIYFYLLEINEMVKTDLNGFLSLHAREVRLSK